MAALFIYLITYYDDVLTQTDDPLTYSARQLQRVSFPTRLFNTVEIQTSSKDVCLLYHTQFKDASFSASAPADLMVA